MMKQITFGNYKSYDDLHLILNKKTIGSPETKTYTVDVDGADGVLDYTEYFGEPKYNNLQHSFEFSTIVPQSQFMDLFSAIKDALHGQKVHIILDDDSNYFYIGRISVSNFTNEKSIGTITIACDCDPYKYKKTITTVSKTVSGSSTITLSNMRKRVVPTITTTASFKFEFGNFSVTHNAGTFVIPEFELVKGNNSIKLTGTGTATFKYQEGGL